MYKYMYWIFIFPCWTINKSALVVQRHSQNLIMMHPIVSELLEFKFCLPIWLGNPYLGPF